MASASSGNNCWIVSQNDYIIHIKVGMNQFVPHAGHLLPFNIREIFSDLLMLRQSFSNPQQQIHERSYKESGG